MGYFSDLVRARELQLAYEMQYRRAKKKNNKKQKEQ